MTKIIIVHKCRQCPYLEHRASGDIICPRYEIYFDTEAELNRIHADCRLHELPDLKIKSSGTNIKYELEKE